MVTATIGEWTDLLAAVAWPLVAIVICLVFRAPLTAMLRRADEIKGPGGFSISAKGQDAAAKAIVEASTAKPMDGSPVSTADAASGVENAAKGVEALGRSPQVLWVDDNPSNNRREIAALTSLGMHVSLSTTTDDAVTRVATHGPFDVIISDMGRPPDTRAGYTLLDSLRSRGNRTPFVIYAASRSPEHFNEAVQHGAIGCTNRPDELIDMVSNALRAAVR
jgi:CheY-like chemotaxis protein